MSLAAWRSPIAAALPLLCVAAVALGQPTTSKAGSGLSCAYVKAGAPGPQGNWLRITDRTASATHIFRDGAEIVVASNLFRQPTACAGRTPTVFNLDRISYASAGRATAFINYSGQESFAPGVTPERGASEIELHLRGTQVLNLGGTAGPDFMVAGRLGRRKIGVNVNFRADLTASRTHPDADVILHSRRIRFVRIRGDNGVDEIGDRGGRGFAGPFSGGSIRLMGDGSSDLMRGGDGAEQLAGGPGPDRMYAYGGADRIDVGPGADQAHGYGGADRISNRSGVGASLEDLDADRVYGEGGPDRIDVATGSPLTDVVFCGRGRDTARVDPSDQTEGCERVEVVP